MRLAGTYRTAWTGALFACTAFSACTYDFDTLVAQTGSGGTAGSGGLAGQGGASGAAGSADGGGAADGGGTAGAAGSGGAAGSAGASGTGGTAIDGGKGDTAVDAGKSDTTVDGGRGDGPADAGKGGDADVATDRRPDTIGDVRSEAPAFDCTAVSGTIYQGHCYYPSPTLSSWDVAVMTACAAPAHLAVITTAGEQGVVAAILAGQDRWIGLRKDPGPPNQESRFHWVTMEAAGIKFWDPYDSGAPEPNFSGDCVRMRSTNNWGDTACTETFAAVCEYE